MGVATDISEFVLADVFRHAMDGVFVLDRERRVVFFSAGCERITGSDPGAILGSACACHQFAECRDEQDRSLSGPLCPSLNIFSGNITVARQRMSIARGDGQRVWIETCYSPMYDDGGEVAYVVGLMRDVTDVMDREQELREAAEKNMPFDISQTTTNENDPQGAATGEGAVSPDGSTNMGPLDQMLTSIERREILLALQRAKGQRTLAARLLGISRSRLYRRMEALGIDPREVGSSLEG